MFILELIVIPNSSCNKFILEESGIKLKIMQPPIDGVANKKIIEILAKHFSCRKNEISLISGEFARKKKFLLKSLSHEEGNNLLQKLLKQS